MGLAQALANSSLVVKNYSMSIFTKAIIGAVVLLLAVGCTNSSKTVDLLQGVGAHLQNVRVKLGDAVQAIEAADREVVAASGGVNDATKSAKGDDKELREAKKTLDSPWVRFILWVRKWFYIGLTLYLVVGITSGVLLARNVATGIANFILNEIPFASVFKVFGRLFTPKKARHNP